MNTDFVRKKRKIAPNPLVLFAFFAFFADHKKHLWTNINVHSG